MRKLRTILLIAVLCSVISCAYKPRVLSFKGEPRIEQSCFLLGSEVSNQQKIYYRVKNQFAKYPGEKQLRFFYDLTHFIPMVDNQCIEATWRIEKINTEKLFFSSSGKVKDGIKLSVDIGYVVDEKIIKNESFEVTEIGQFYSGFTATKKKVDNSIINLLEKAFVELYRQVSNSRIGF